MRVLPGRAGLLGHDVEKAMYVFVVAVGLEAGGLGHLVQLVQDEAQLLVGASQVPEATRVAPEGAPGPEGGLGHGLLVAVEDAELARIPLE